MLFGRTQTFREVFKVYEILTFECCFSFHELHAMLLAVEYQIQVYTCALSFGSIWPCCGMICSSGPLYQTYVDNCEAVPCPFNSSGVSISHGCHCNAGYRGHIEAAMGFPYHTGACVAVECPANSSGDSLPVGCRCLPGYAGDIKATKTAPYYRSTCAAVDCPAGSVGASVASGCSCAPGFQGEISAESQEPFYSGTCFNQKPCLRHSVFRHFRRQCQCFPGYKDVQGSCVALECPQTPLASTCLWVAIASLAIEGLPPKGIKLNVHLHHALTTLLVTWPLVVVAFWAFQAAFFLLRWHPTTEGAVKKT